MPDIKLIRIVNGRVQPRVEFDIPLNADGTFAGNPVILSGVDRAIQDVVKGVLTIKGSNFMVLNYGTSVNELIHTRKLANIAEQLKFEIQKLLGYLGKFTLEEDPSERVEELVSLDATEKIDTIELNLVVKTGGGQTVSILI